MSHGDAVSKIPQGFRVIGFTDNSPYTAIGSESQQLFGNLFVGGFADLD